MYNNVVERCFRDCVESFRRKDLDNGEERVGAATRIIIGIYQCGYLVSQPEWFAAVCHKMLREVYETLCKGWHAFWRAVKSGRTADATSHAAADRTMTSTHFCCGILVDAA